MKLQYFGNNKYIVSFQKYELAMHPIILLTNKFSKDKRVKKISDYNYVIPTELIHLIEDTRYYPFTKKEVEEAETETRKFMYQFDDIVI